MVPDALRSLFWDVDVTTCDVTAHKRYAIGRVLELGDPDAVTWMRSTFEASDIAHAIKSDRRLSRRSATFWGLVYGVPSESIAALVGPARTWRGPAARA